MTCSKPPRRFRPRASALKSRAFWVLLALVALALGLGCSIRLVGYFLVVEDPLAHARAIVVLGGALPFRAMEAATIYRQGWAPEVWMLRAESPSEELALTRLHVSVTPEDVYNREVLERSGVPPTAIRLLGQRVLNTKGELRAVAQELRLVGGYRVIIVTSKPHSRRVRTIWRAIVGPSPKAIVRYATEDPFDPDHWWQRTGDALAVSREVLGLLNVWAGFPVTREK